MSQVEFIVSPEAEDERRFSLPPGEYVVGSGDDCEIVLPLHGVAPRHARLILKEQSCVIADLGGTGGTFLGRERLSDLPAVSGYPAALRFGEALVRVGLVEAGDPAETQVESSPGLLSLAKSRAIRISRYRMGGEIAKGGMGSILAAEDASLKRTVAMKVLLPQVEGSADARRRFHREAAVLGRLEHPNIVPIHELGHDEHGRPFYTMKRVKGRTLAAILRAIRKGDEATIGHYTLDRLLDVFAKVCDALAFTHFSGIVHRDLKPENIMVGEFGEVLVMDWGVAKVLDDAEQADEEARRASEAQAGARPGGIELGTLTLDGAVVGTPHYMSPEQARGRLAEIDQRSDVFALGGILYTILTLRKPVDGSSVEEILKAIVRGAIRPPERFNPMSGGSATKGFPHCPGGRIPSAVSAIAMRALAPDKADRYPNVVQLAADIDAYRRGYATSAEELGTLGQLRLLVVRHRRELLAVAVIWAGLTVALRGGRAIGSLAMSVGFAGSFIMIGLAIWFVFRLAKAERGARSLAADAREEARRARERVEASAGRAEQARRELEEARASLAHAQVIAAELLCRAGDGRAALKQLARTVDAHRTPEWREIFARARELSLRQD